MINAVSMIRTALICVCLGGPAVATEFYVSPAGNDSNPGTKSKPFATIEAARDAVRKLPKGDGITVWIRGGVYERRSSFVLGKEDSGVEGAPVVYRACEGEDVRFLGGRRVPATAFKPVTDAAVLERIDESARKHVRCADLAALGMKDFGEPGVLGKQAELFFNGSTMTLARWPNDGYVKVAAVEKTEPFQKRGRRGDRVGRLVYDGDRPRRWVAEADHMLLHGYWFWDWAEAYERVESIDPERRMIATRPPYHHYGYRPGQRYYALNLLCELDSPGEWFIDHEVGVLYFWPPRPLDDGSEVCVSVLDEPVVSMKDVSHVVIRGVAMEMTRGMAADISGGTGNLVAGCTIRNTGADGIHITGGAKNGVTACEIYATGACGVVLSGGDRATLEPGGHFATNNHIHHFSRIKRTYAGAVHLNGVGNRMANNYIHHGPHLAVLFGGNDHVMELNRIHNVCEETGDVGCFYTGRDWTSRGNIIRHNFIHDVSGPGSGGSFVVYLDDAASGGIVTGNIIYHCSVAMLFGGGRDNVVENNLIVDCTAHSIYFDNRGMNWMAYHVKPGGIMPERLKAVPYKQPPWSDRYPKLVNILEDDPGVPKGNIIRRNVVVRTRGFKLAGEVRQFGTVKNNLQTDDDVGFVDKAAMDFRLKKSSIIYEKVPGFEPIPFDKIGLRKDEYREQIPE